MSGKRLSGVKAIRGKLSFTSRKVTNADVTKFDTTAGFIFGVIINVFDDKITVRKLMPTWSFLGRTLLPVFFGSLENDEEENLITLYEPRSCQASMATAPSSIRASATRPHLLAPPSQNGDRHRTRPQHLNRLCTCQLTRRIRIVAPDGDPLSA
jgi:hypothetical protein